jgi:predicted double-glycine peptidase
MKSMQLGQRKSIRLHIPFYRQHYDFTCGPASLMMAMKYLGSNVHLSKDSEIDIRREGNMVEVYGTSRYGMAYSAAIRGFGAREQWILVLAGHAIPDQAC